MGASSAPLRRNETARISARFDAQDWLGDIRGLGNLIERLVWLTDHLWVSE
jgi:DNA-binding NtrC family response regulator